MKTESGPTRYRLARRRIRISEYVTDEEYILQGWFEWKEFVFIKDVGGTTEYGGEWRDLETVDIE